MVALSPKKILSELGLVVSKAAPAGRSLSVKASPSKGWLVELVGPSGVGKTTLRDEVTAGLKDDWFFEHHAKGMLGQVQEDAAMAAYLKPMLANRLKMLQGLDIPLERMAEISQRACEVVRLGLVTKSGQVPRGFVMDDGILHFFAEQILAQKPKAAQPFLEQTAFVFLLPQAADEEEAKRQLEVYRALRDYVQGLGKPMIVLDPQDREGNPGRVLSFIRNDVLGA